VWKIKRNAEKFLEATKQLKELVSKESTVLDWDKDIDQHLDFVTAAANLRCSIFNIQLSSRFDVKSKAGNVIPAIATTNAVIAGLMVLEAFKLLKNQHDKCRNIYLFQQPSGNRVLMPSRIPQPDPNCYVCGSKFATVKINVQTTTLQDFIEKIVRGEFNIQTPYIYRMDSSCIYEPKVDEDSEDEGMDYQLEKTLAELNMIDNEIIKLEDSDTNYELDVSIIHQTQFSNEERPFEIAGERPGENKRPKLETTVEENNDAVIIAKPSQNKRKRSNDNPNPTDKNTILLDETYHTDLGTQIKQTCLTPTLKTRVGTRRATSKVAGPEQNQLQPTT